MNPITDRFGVPLGYSKDEGDNTFYYDRMGVPVGRYDKNSNTTFDNMGVPQYQGNMGPSLIKDKKW